MDCLALTVGKLKRLLLQKYTFYLQKETLQLIEILLLLLFCMSFLSGRWDSEGRPHVCIFLTYMFSSWHQCSLQFPLPSRVVNTILNTSSLANNNTFCVSLKVSDMEDLTWHSLCLGSFSLNFFFNFFFPSAQVPDNDEQFVPDYQAESCKYSLTHLLIFSLPSFLPSFFLFGLFLLPVSCTVSMLC